MKALQYTAPERLELLEIPEPDGECVVRVLGCAICGTDLKTFLRGHPYFKPPVILGHEFYGTVERAPHGGGFAPGDAVVVAPYGECGQCPACAAGHGEMCRHKRYVPTGAFTEKVEVPADFMADGMIRLPDPDPAYALTEPLACVLQGLSQLSFHAGSRALVVGGGPMGALFAMALDQIGQEAAVVEVNEARRAQLATWGIRVLDGQADIGYRDNIVLAVNKPDLAAHYLSQTADNGTLHIFSGMPQGSVLSLDAGAIHYRGVTVTGSSGFSLPHFRRAFEMIRQSPALYRRLITHTFPLSQGEQAFRLFQSGEAFKVMLTP